MQNREELIGRRAVKAFQTPYLSPLQRQDSTLCVNVLEESTSLVHVCRPGMSVVTSIVQIPLMKVLSNLSGTFNFFQRSEGTESDRLIIDEDVQAEKDRINLTDLQHLFATDRLVIKNLTKARPVPFSATYLVNACAELT